MPKTHRLELAAIADWGNVARALGRACRGKRSNAAVRRLLGDVDRTIAEISAALRQGRLPVGRFRAFEIHDPKRRLIHAAPLEDRVAHHALIRHMEPVLERALLPSVFACRVGKGVHAAIHHAQKQARRFLWVMHLDIAGYFPSIEHGILRTQLCRRFRGDGLRLAGALRAGGSINQRPVLFRRSQTGGQSPGPRRVSRQPVDAGQAESLPVGRLFQRRVGSAVRNDSGSIKYLRESVRTADPTCSTFPEIGP